MKKRILSILLAAIMVVSFFPVLSTGAAADGSSIAASDCQGFWRSEAAGLAVNLSYLERDSDGEERLSGYLRSESADRVYELNLYSDPGGTAYAYFEDVIGSTGEMYAYFYVDGNTITFTPVEVYGTIGDDLGTLVLTKDTTVYSGKVEKQAFTAVCDDVSNWTVTLDGTLSEGEAWIYMVLPYEDSAYADDFLAEVNQYLYAPTALVGNECGLEQYIMSGDPSLMGILTTGNTFTITGGMSAIFVAKVDNTGLLDMNGMKYILRTVGAAVVGDDTELSNQMKDTVTVTFNWGGHGASTLPATKEITLRGTLSDMTPTDDKYTFVAFTNDNGDPVSLKTPIKCDTTLTAMWMPTQAQVNLIWLDSLDEAIPGAPETYTIDLSAFNAAYRTALESMDYSSAQVAMDELSAAIYEDLEEYLLYSNYYYNSEWNVTGADGYTSTYEYPKYVPEIILSYLLNNPTAELTFTLQCPTGYDTVKVTLYDYSEATFTYSGILGQYAADYADLKSAIEDPSTAGDYLPAVVYDNYNGKVITVARTVAELEETLASLSKYVSDVYYSYRRVLVSKYNEPSISLTWLDVDEEPLTGAAYPETYAMTMIDYYAAKSNAEKAEELEKIRADFDAKLGTALAWDNGYGTWDLGEYSGYFYGYYNKITADDLFDLLVEYGVDMSSIALCQHDDAFEIYWGASDIYYSTRDFYGDASSIDLTKWQAQYAADLAANLDAYEGETFRVYFAYRDMYGDTSSKTEYVRNEEELIALLDSLPQSCREDRLVYVELEEYTGTPLTFSWYDKEGEVIDGLPTEYLLDLSMGSAGCGEAFYEEYGEILDSYAQLTDSYASFTTNAVDVMAYAAVQVEENGYSSFTFYEYDGNYIFKGDVAYRIDSDMTVDMWGYYNYRWLKTTYSNQGYRLRSSGLGNADVKLKVTVADGKNLLLAYTVTAPKDKAIEGGKLGIWTDVMIGDNDGATVSTVFDDAGNKVGFDLLDDGWHYGSYYNCYSLNAKYTCYMAGENMVNAAQKILKVSDPVDGSFWYGDYSYAYDHCLEELNADNAETSGGYYNDDYSALYGEDSGVAAHWDVDLEAGESQTYCVVFGIVDASMDVAPRFIGGEPRLAANGFVSVDVANLIENKSSGHYILLMLDTEDGEQLNAGKSSLQARVANKDSLYAEGDEKNDADQIARFVDALVDAFPGTYVITGMTATNDGGLTTEYVLADEGYQDVTMTIPSSPREEPLYLAFESIENKREGWSYSAENEELTVHSLDITTGEGHEDEPAIQMPAGIDITVESFKNEDGTPGENKINSAGNGIEISGESGDGASEIAGDGTLSITAAETGITTENALEVKAETVIEAKTGISSSDDVTISGEVTISATEVGIECDTLYIEDGGTLTINIEDGAAFLDVTKVVIPEGYEILGGTIDENGVITPDQDATQLVIREIPIIPVTINATAEDFIYGEDKIGYKDLSVTDYPELEDILDITYYQETTTTGTYETTGSTEVPTEVGNYKVVFSIPEDTKYYTGSLELTFTISKTGPATAPAVTEADAVTATTVTLPVSGDPNVYEYSADGKTWTDSNRFTGLEPASEFTYYVRVKETETALPSEATAITGHTAYDISDSDIYAIDYDAETVAILDGYEISYTDAPDFSAEPLVDGKLTVEPGMTYYIRKASSEDPAIPESETIRMVLSERPDAPDDSAFTVNEESVQNKKDGSISGITNAMEYSTDGGDTWTSGPATVMDLSDETVMIRTKANGSAFAGEPYTYTFTPSEELLTIAIGDTEQQVAFGDKLTKPEDPTKPGYTFDGWYTDAECTDEWDFDQDTVSEEMTLYPKWIEDEIPEGIISGSITENDVELIGAAVELYQGTQKIAATTTDKNGNYAFDSVDAGIYNLIITDANGKTMTLLVEVGTGSQELNVKLPAEAISSSVEFTGTEIPGSKALIMQTVVGGLEAVMKNTDLESGDTVTIKLMVTPAADTGTSEQNAIKAAAGSAAKVEFLDLTLLKQVNAEPASDIGGSNDQLLTIVVPFDFTNVKVNSVKVLRSHQNSVDLLVTTPNASGEYIELDVANGRIKFHTMKFSTYAIIYEEDTAPIPSPAQPTTYPVVGPESTENGKLIISRKEAYADEKVMLTVKPDEGYVLDSLTVTDKKGSEIALTDLGNGKFSFVMPASKATVAVSFKAIGAEEPNEEPESKPCPMDETCPIAKFSDTTIDFWWHDGIHYCLANGLMKGVSDTEFAPNGTTSRAMIVTILWRLEGEKVANYAMSFSDVAEDMWYTEPIRWAASEGIVLGYDDGTYKPDKAITREELAAILYRYAQKKGEGFVGESMFLMPFEDLSEISDWASEAVRWCFMKGIILGRTETTFVPKATATRAEAATMMQRFCQNLEK